MGYPIKKGSTARDLVFFMVLTSDHLTGATGKTVTVTLSKNGAAFGAAAGAVSEISSGWYKVAGNATDSNTGGALALHATAAACDATDDRFDVRTPGPDDTYVIRSGTATSVGAATIGLAAEAAPGTDFFRGCTVRITGGTTGVGLEGLCISSTNANPPVLTMERNWNVALTGTTTYEVEQGALGPEAADIADKILIRSQAGGSDAAAKSLQRALMFLNNKKIRNGANIDVYDDAGVGVAFSVPILTTAGAAPVTTMGS